MIGKLISAGIGSKIAQSTPGISEGAGAMLGVAAATAVRRLGPVGMIAAAAGVWYYSQRAKEQELAAKRRRKAATSPRKTVRKDARKAPRAVKAPEPAAATA